MSRASEIRDWLNGRGDFPVGSVENALGDFEQRIRAEERKGIAAIVADWERRAIAAHGVDAAAYAVNVLRNIQAAIRARGGGQ
jgi:hypothetical protein